MQDISSAIEKLNIASADKEKLKDEVDSLNREQRVLQGKIDQTDRALEAERAKKRAAEREMNEINLQINQKRLSGAAAGNGESTRIQYLREEIAKKQVQISTAQRDYKNALETRTDSFLSGGHGGMHGSPAPKSAAADNANLIRLESEMGEIRAMLNDYGLKSKNTNANRLSDLLRDVDAEDAGNSHNVSMSGHNPFADVAESGSSDQIAEFVKRQKADIKEMQEKLEVSKRQYKNDKASVEALRVSDPALYRKKHVVLEKVKETLEKRIEKLNQRIAKVKEIEAKNNV